MIRSPTIVKNRGRGQDAVLAGGAVMAVGRGDEVGAALGGRVEARGLEGLRECLVGVLALGRLRPRGAGGGVQEQTRQQQRDQDAASSGGEDQHGAIVPDGVREK